MDTDEREIFEFLKILGRRLHQRDGNQPARGRQKRFHEDPNWAKPILMRMTERGILQNDTSGRFRIKPVPRKTKHSQWVSPDIAKILKESGVEVEGAGDGALAPDEHYDNL